MLLGFRIIYQPLDLLQAIIDQRKLYKEQDKLSDEVEERFYAFIIQWLLLWNSDFECKELSKKLLSFATLAFQSYHQALPYLDSLVQDNTIPSSGYLSPKSNDKKPISPKVRAERRLSGIFQKNNRNRDAIFEFTDVFSYDSETIAKQLTLIEASIVRSIPIIDIIKKNWLNAELKESCPLKVLSSHFNRISLWVATAIMSCDTFKKKCRMYKKFVRIAKVCIFFFFFVFLFKFLKNKLEIF